MPGWGIRLRVGGMYLAGHERRASKPCMSRDPAEHRRSLKPLYVYGPLIEAMYQHFGSTTAESAALGSRSMTDHAVVLVVDDERYIVDLLTDLFQDEGYKVQRAYDGLSALDAIDREIPDLVVADVMMPRLDGLSLFNEIRERHADLPVILMSAAVTPRDLNATFIPKPFDIDALLDLVEEKLSGRQH